MRHIVSTLLAPLFLLTGILTGCIQDSPSSMVGDNFGPQLVPARIKSIVSGSTDTAITLLRYDRDGFLTREIRATTVREWDSLGRYTGVRIRDSARYLERVEWPTRDSTLRTQPPSTVLRDRFFNRRPNCWCADSIRHSINETYTVTRKFQYDALGNPLQVTLTWASDGRTETIQSYLNTYDEKWRLVSVYVQDGESGQVVTTTRLIEYDTLKNVTELR